MQENVTPHILLNEIDRVISQRDALSARIGAFAPVNAASVIAKYLIGGRY
jgi:hypothetical protein